MRIASFDIGLRTCSMCVEDYKIDQQTLPQPPSLKSRYDKTTKEASQAMQQYIDTIGLCGSIIHIEKRDLGDKKTFHGGYAFFNLYSWLDELDKHLSSCDIILIEQQMQTNSMALTLMNHLYSWLLVRYIHTQKRNMTIKLYPSKNKTRVLGAPLKLEEESLQGTTLKAVSKYQRKKWSTEQANQLLQARADDIHHEYIFVTNKSKRDDLSDVIMQTLSYMVTHCLNEK